MTFIILILLFTLGFGLLLAAELLRAGSADKRLTLGSGSDSLAPFGPLERLILEEDAVLPQENAKPTRRLDSRQRRVLRAYLGELRSEFVRAFGVCRLLAPVSRDPDFLSNLLRSYVAFHFSYYSMWVSCLTGVRLSGDQIRGLKQPLDLMRSQATELLDIDAAMSADAGAR
jgi:hypothetical protein